MAQQMEDLTLTLAQAAHLIHRSEARTRMLVHKGRLGEWTRSDMGHLQLSLAGVRAFVPLRPGDKSTATSSAKTQVRHLHAVIKLVAVDAAISGSDKDATLRALAEILVPLVAQAAAEAAEADEITEDEVDELGRVDKVMNL